MSAKLGDMLLKAGLIAQHQLDHALKLQENIGGKIGAILVKLRYLSDETLAKFIGTQMNLPVLPLRDLVVAQQVSGLVDVEFLEKHQLLPLYRKDDTLMLAVADPTDLSSLDELKFLTGLRIDCAVAARQDIHKAIDYYFHGRACPELRENEKNVLQAGRSAEPQKNIPIPPLGKTERLDSDVVSEQRDAVRMIKALAELLVEKKLVKADELAKHGIAL